MAAQGRGLDVYISSRLMTSHVVRWAVSYLSFSQDNPGV